ncbi:MAG: SHOCT-like domain-containing protein, partial [Bellilinea sp.]
MSEERLELLRKIEAGEVSPEEGLRLINALEEGTADQPQVFIERAVKTEELTERVKEVDVIETASEKSAPPDYRRWRRFSWVVFGVMVLLTGLSAVWMILGWMSRPWGWGFWLAWLPFLIGVV